MVGSSKGGYGRIMGFISILRDDRTSIKAVMEMSRKFHKEAGVSAPFEPVRVSSFLVGVCESPNAMMAVAIDKFGNRVGYVVAQSFQNYLTGALMSEETAIYVDPDYRQYGAGDKLLDEFERWSIEEKKVRVLRVTCQANLRMAGVMKWFKSRGYKEAEMSLTKEVSY